MLAVVATVTVLTACSDDDTQQGGPQIYFGQYYYTLGKANVVLTLNADKAPDADVTIPVRFGGDAQEGVDYEAPEKAFLLKAGETQATMTLNRIDENIPDDAKNLYVNLQSAPAGFTLGLANFATVNLLGNNGVIVNFKSSEGAVKFTEDFTVELTDMKGKQYRPAAETTFDIVVDESSTAVEGENFEFIGGPHVVVKKGQSKGTFSIKFLKKEEGKDKLVLRFADKLGYATGNTPEMALAVSGPDVFTGTWAFDQISNMGELEMYGDDYLNLKNLPKGSSADRLTFEGNNYEEYVFKPELSGDLKKYFGNTVRKVTFKEAVKKNFYEYSGAEQVSILEIPDVNLNFSATYNDTSRPALVGFRIIKGSDGEDILECVLDDFQPKGNDYGADLYLGFGEPGNMADCPLHLHFKRVK